MRSDCKKNIEPLINNNWASTELDPTELVAVSRMSSSDLQRTERKIVEFLDVLG